MIKSQICLIVGFQQSGKTTLLNQLQAQGYHTINADEYIHQFLYQKNQLGYVFVKQSFGVNFVNDKEVDREKLKQFFQLYPDQLPVLTRFVNHFLNLYIKNYDHDVFVELPTYYDYETSFNFDVSGVIFLKPVAQNEDLFKLPKLEMIYQNLVPLFDKSPEVCYYFDNNRTIQYVLKIETLISKLGMRKD